MHILQMKRANDLSYWPQRRQHQNDLSYPDRSQRRQFHFQADFQRWDGGGLEPRPAGRRGTPRRLCSTSLKIAGSNPVSVRLQLKRMYNV